MAEREELTNSLGGLLWHWQGENPISPDALAKKIMGILDAQQKHVSRPSRHSLPDASETLRAMETSSNRTEIPLPRECLDEHQGE